MIELSPNNAFFRHKMIRPVVVGILMFAHDDALIGVALGLTYKAVARQMISLRTANPGRDLIETLRGRRTLLLDYVALRARGKPAKDE